MLLPLSAAGKCDIRHTSAVFPIAPQTTFLPAGRGAVEDVRAFSRDWLGPSQPVADGFPAREERVALYARSRRVGSRGASSRAAPSSRSAAPPLLSPIRLSLTDAELNQLVFGDANRPVSLRSEFTNVFGFVPPK